MGLHSYTVFRIQPYKLILWKALLQRGIGEVMEDIKNFGLKVFTKEVRAQAGNVAVSIILIIIYAHFFGKPSFDKYVNEGIIIIKKDQRTLEIPPPGKFR